MIELCLENLEDVFIANRYDNIVDRIELNSALELGGLSPNILVLKEARKSTKIPIIAMLRIRGGNFNYSMVEHSLHRILAKELLKYADGIAYGSLNDELELNIEQIKDIIEICKERKKEFVFHRAIDECKDYFESIKILNELGVDRILTSGHEENAELGIKNLNKIESRATILAGCGINIKNINLFKKFEVHGTFKPIRKNLEILNSIYSKK